MVSHALSPCAHIKRPIFWKVPGLGISNMNFLITDVSGTMIYFSQGGAAKIKSKQFSEFGSRTKSSFYIQSEENRGAFPSFFQT